MIDKKRRRNEEYNMNWIEDGYMRLQYFTETVAADTRRKEFDIRNHSLIYKDLHPDFLFIGDSIDLEGDYWKKLEPAPYEEVLEHAQRNVESIIKKAENSETTLILASLLPIGIPVSMNESLRKQYVRDFNNWLKETAERNNLIFVDYYGRMIRPESGELMEGITYDGIRSNGKGYEIMADVLKEALKKNEIYI